MSISTWLITGASSGLGYALAEHVLKQGDQVFGALDEIRTVVVARIERERAEGSMRDDG